MYESPLNQEHRGTIHDDEEYRTPRGDEKPGGEPFGESQTSTNSSSDSQILVNNKRNQIISNSCGDKGSLANQTYHHSHRYSSSNNYNANTIRAFNNSKASVKSYDSVRSPGIISETPELPPERYGHKGATQTPERFRTATSELPSTMTDTPDLIISETPDLFPTVSGDIANTPDLPPDSAEFEPDITPKFSLKHPQLIHSHSLEQKARET
eukprot:UN06963